MLSCFGRRKKKKNKDPKAGEAKASAPEPKPNLHRPGNDVAAAGDPADGPQVRQHVTPQTHAAPGNSPQKQSPAIDEPEVAEVITMVRSQSVRNAPLKPGNIKKAATMSRYDFMRKQDDINYADKWAALRQRYLEQKLENGEAGGGGGGLLSPDTAQNGGSPLSRRKVLALSLPRQFSPSSPPPHSPVTFSGWFYDRQAKEQEARREFHDREERMRKIIDGPSKDEMEDAAVKIQAGFKGYRTRKDLQAKKEMQHQSSS